MKTIFLTGANKGLGLEFTRQYLEQGNRVIATCRNKGKASELMSLVTRYHGFLEIFHMDLACLLYTSPSPRDRTRSRMPSSA